MGFWKDFFSDDDTVSSGELKEVNKTYELPRDILLKKLGLESKKISFIQYDWKKQVLVIKEGDYKKWVRGL